MSKLKQWANYKTVTIEKKFTQYDEGWKTKYDEGWKIDLFANSARKKTKIAKLDWEWLNTFRIILIWIEKN